MSDAVFTYYSETHDVTFQWHGGEYIGVGHVAAQDTGPFNNQGQPSYYKGEFVASDCINVWDYAANEPMIDRDLSSFQAACEEWLRRGEIEEEEDDDEDREPTDNEIYNSFGMEGGIAYDTTGDTRDEHDPTL